MIIVPPASFALKIFNIMALLSPYKIAWIDAIPNSWNSEHLPRTAPNVIRAEAAVKSPLRMVWMLRSIFS